MSCDIFVRENRTLFISNVYGMVKHMPIMLGEVVPNPFGWDTRWCTHQMIGKKTRPFHDTKFQGLQIQWTKITFNGQILVITKHVWSPSKDYAI